MEMSAPADIFYFAMHVSLLPEWDVSHNTKKRAWGALFIR